MPDEFFGLEGKERRVRDVGKIDDLGVMREVLRAEIRLGGELILIRRSVPLNFFLCGGKGVNE